MLSSKIKMRSIIRSSAKLAMSVHAGRMASFVRPAVLVQNFRQFSSSADKDSLAELIPQEIAVETSEVEIDQEYLDVKKTILKNFAIKESSGEAVVELSRAHGKESVVVKFDVQNESEDEDQGEGEEGEIDHEADMDDVDENQPEPVYGINFEVIVSKPDGAKLAFDCMAGDKLSIKNVQVIAAGQDLESQDNYSGPRFGDLEPSVQDAFYNFLEDRKVDDDLSFFVLAHSREKEQAEYLNWLKGVLSFVATK